MNKSHSPTAWASGVSQKNSFCHSVFGCSLCTHTGATLLKMAASFYTHPAKHPAKGR